MTAEERIKREHEMVSAFVRENPNHLLHLKTFEIRLAVLWQGEVPRIQGFLPGQAGYETAPYEVQFIYHKKRAQRIKFRVDYGQRPFAPTGEQN